MHKYTLKELQDLPTIEQDDTDDLKIKTEEEQVWLSRIGIEDGEPYNHKVTVWIYDKDDCYWRLDEQYPAVVEEETEVDPRAEREEYTIAKFIKEHPELKIKYCFVRYVEYTYKAYHTYKSTTKIEYKCTMHMNGRQATFRFVSSGEPTKYDLLTCLASDCSVVEYSSLKEFIEQFGYSWDDIGINEDENIAFSRDPKKIYRACERGAKKLKQFFGQDLFDLFMRATDNALEDLTEEENECIEVW